MTWPTASRCPVLGREKGRRQDDFTWFRWAARVAALALVVAAVVLVVTEPTVGYVFSGQHLTGTCSTPWSNWRHPFNFPVPSDVGMLLNACAPTYPERWHLAWGIVLGALVLGTASFASSLGLRRIPHAHKVRPT
ncbi:MAG: hypothetical protein ACLQCU_02675 [Acidimicrobiales bacterium]